MITITNHINNKRMAGIRGRILAVTFVFCTILPLIASTFINPFREVPDFFNGIPGLGNGFNNPNLGNHGAFGGIFRGPGFGHHHHGGSNRWDRNNINKVQPQMPPIIPANPAPKVKPAPAKRGLQIGFYQQTCPQAEKIVQDTMLKILNRDVKLAPALVRLFFHDCFVTGCDASIMLDQTPSGEKVEKTAPQNGNFVRGFNELEEIKAALEAACPGIVSCADILTFATREALNQTGVPRYNIASGRRDRPVSLAKNCQGNLPFPDSPVEESLRMFTKKGMTLDDLVLLTGAHSIGEAHCTIVSNRLRDPVKRKDISPRYLDQLNVQLFCQDPDQTLPFDRMSSNIMDVGYYKQLLAKETLLEADANLAKDPNGNRIMRRFANDQNGFMGKFVQSIIKLGEVEVLTGDEGEIRRQCKVFN